MNVRLGIILVFVAVLSALSSSWAQTDSVCVSNPIGTYHVVGWNGSTFTWDTGGDGFILNGQGNDSITVAWNASVGTYTLSVFETSIDGCDGPTQYLTIEMIEYFEEIDVQICTGQNYTLPDGVVVNSGGTYDATLVSVLGCDSVIRTNITVTDVLTSTTDITICSNQVPYNWNGVDYSTEGTYTANLLTVAGCDSIATLNLSINPTLTSTTSITICSNQVPYNWNGTDYSTAGTYTANLLTVAGCDSVATLNLSINDVLTSTTDITICSNQVPYNWNGVDYNAAGSYTANLLTVAGCDSVATLNLSINDVLTSSTDITICNNQVPYNWNGVDYSTEGTYTANLLTVAGCDSIATLNLSINDVLTSTTNITICSNQVPYNWNGVDYSSAGTYTANLLTVAGCDSVATLNLSINDVLTSTTDITICSNQVPYNWNGVDYSTAGTYTSNLLTVAGCDSIATLNLSINDVLTSTTNITICSNQVPYSWNGVDYNAAGTYAANLLTVAGCDSIATLNLSINDVLTSTTDITICNNQVPYSWNGVDYSTAGTYTANLLTVAGCDSIATLNLSINDVLTSTTNITICNNQVPYSWNGVDYNAAGTYTANLLTVAGCDSIATLNLVINDVLASTTDITICSNQVPYSWNGVDYSTAGTYTANLLTVAGCDSVATLNLAINDVLTSTTDITICNNQVPYNWNGVDYSTAGTYTANLLTVAGCDSIATLNLAINDVLTSTTDITICNNQVPYNWNGVDYSGAGTYTANLLTVAGCDSVATLNLSINDVLTSTTDITICSNQVPYNWNGVDYSTAGTYTANLLTVAGCDSIATLNLAINDVLTSTTDITICSNQVPYNWNGVDYNAAGTYTANLLTVAGCDSIATLNLSINDVLTSSTDITICSNQVPYNWNGVDYSTEGIYTSNLLTVAGCDSIATLNLAINDVLTSTTDITICSNQVPYSWNGVDYNAAGTYTANLLTVAGCDSVATLNLSINDVLTSTTDVTICSNQIPYSWNGVDYNAAGSYTANLLTVAGCDSVATLNLTINDVLTSTTDVAICSNQVPYNWNGVDYSTAGTYTANLLTVAGCDSIATLNLSINDVLTSTTDITICSNQVPYNWNGVDYSTAGTYTSNLLTVAGCDSVATLNLSINDVLTSITDITICSNQVPYNWNGVDYNAAGTYTANLLTVAGCDSIATLNLSINDVLTSSTDITICSNQVPYNWNGVDYNAAGTYTANLLTVAGCDSIATLNLSINPTLTSTTNITICSNQVPYNWNGIDYSTAGTFTANLLTVAGCDSIATLNLSINDVLTSITDITICSNQVPYSWNGVDYNAAGTYTANLLTIAGCDSVATLNLSINPTLTSTTNITICSNQVPYNWNGIDYSNAGTYTANLLTVAGCDSIATLNLSINDELTSTTDITICSNQVPYNWNGVDYSTAGTYTANLLTVAGCDSIATLNLVINDVLTSITDITICSNQVPYSWNGVDYNAAGTYTANLLTVAGCDSVATLNLLINDVLTSTTDITICSNQVPYNWNGVDYSTAGTYTADLLTVVGCDSVATLNLAINDVLTSTTDITICSNQVPYSWNGVDYSSEGTYTANLLTIAGCDSVATLNLSINPTLTSTTNITICSNQVPYSWNGVDYSTAGTYTANLLTIAGCDSVATLNLSINPTLTSTTNITICSNQVPYNWNGVDYSTAGTYTANLLTVAGCDSIATLNLGINDVLTSITDITICSNQVPYNWNGVDYNAAGTYTANLLTVAGCDSVATLNLSINPTLTSTTNITICSNQVPYNWNGVDYSTPGTYTSNLLTVAGCDSVATLNLSINPTLSSTTNITICSNQAPYNWNGVDYSTAGTYTANLLTVAGCDSIATLNLSINPTLTSTTNITICSNQVPYSWNGVDYNAAGTYTANLLTVAGCDSVATLNLSINPTLTSTTNITICSNQIPYNWNGVDYSTAGTYTANLLTVAGCDSIATLNLSINDVLTSTTDITICSNQVPYNWNSVDYNAAGTYTANLLTVAGCDSVATLNLSINPTHAIAQSVSICQGDSYTLPSGISVNTAGTYTSSFLNVFGCDSTITTNVSFYPAPQLTLTNTTGTNTLTCDVTSIDVLLSGNGASTWLGGVSAPFTAPGSYTAQLTTSNGCSTTQTIVINQDITLPNGIITVPGNTTTLTCSTTTIDLIAVGGSTYQWQNPVSTSNAITIDEPGTYTVEIFGPNGCSVLQSIGIAIDTIAPVAGITNLSGTDLLTCDQTSITLEANGNGTYAWQPSVATSSTLDVTSPETYTLIVTAANGCVDESTYTIFQDINEPAPTELYFEICGDDTHSLPDGTVVNVSGVYPVILDAWNGCDSLVNTTLLVHPVYNETVNVRICPTETYTLPDGQIVSTSGSYATMLQTVFGCDSLITTNLEVLPQYNQVFNVTICPGESYVLPDGAEVVAEGAYALELQSMAGCDSIVTFNLEVYVPVVVQQQVSICNGESYQLPTGSFVNTTGAYPVVLESVFGCDSTVVYNLQVIPNQQQFVNETICQGTEYILPDGTATSQSGVYAVTVESPQGCESTIITTLTIQPQISVDFTPFSDTVRICYGDTVTLTAMGAQLYNFDPNDYLIEVGTNYASAAPPTSMMFYLDGHTGSCADGDSIFVQVIPLPVITATTVEDIICQGDSVMIQAYGAENYEWYPALGASCADCEETLVAPTETTTYQVTGTLNGCDAQGFVTVDVASAPIAYIAPDTSICLQQNITLTATGGGSYLWDTGEDTESITVSPTEPSEYSVVVSIGSCIDTASIFIGVNPIPDVFAGYDTLITLGGIATLEASGAIDYEWTPAEDLTCSTCEVTDASPIITTTYCVEGINEFGCKSTDCVDVQVNVLCDNFFIPNAFAPSKGGHEANDCFQVFGTDCFETYTITIYNRWGEIVFESSNPKDCWDGTYRDKDLNTAVFVYHFEGVLLTGDAFTKQGNISLIR